MLVSNEIKYIGLCDNLSKRWNMGYGNISPKNCFEGGQSTNCRLNNLILSAYNANKQINLFFHKTQDIDAIENDLIEKLNPEWNIKKASGKHFQKPRSYSFPKAKSSRNKYQPLTDYLLKSKKEIECLSYAEIRDLLGFELPYSAFKHRPWWANSGHQHAKTWTDAGWKIAFVVLGESVTFEKVC